MLKIENCAAMITNVNARKELHGDEWKPAFDANLTMRVAAECYRGLLADYDGFIRQLWNEHKELRNVDIKTITFDNVAFDRGMFLIQDKLGNTTQYDNCKIGKFKFYPANFQIARLDFQVQYTADTEDEIVPVFKAERHEGIVVTLSAHVKDKPIKGDKDTQTEMFMAGEEDEEENENEED